MMAETLLEQLNEHQCQAVTAKAQHLLVLAGAGSGKTRVLVHRIAWLIQTQQVSPFSILAVTFTNKAAFEMRSRIEAMLSISTRGMWVGTFHGLSHRLLRAHWREAGLLENFQILDSDDQYRLIKRVQKDLGLSEEKWAPRRTQWFINENKDQGLRPKHIDDHADLYTKTLIKIYQSYEEVCQRAGLVDFAELLLRAYELWSNNEALKTHYQERFAHVLVDEFQDTNTIQYAWIKLLAGEQGYLTIVGDDDQSIYGWRGAKVENIQNFCTHFADAKTIRLEQNYRSTATLLQAANHLIAHNSQRLGKELWTQGKEGEPITVFAAYNDLDEARYIVESISEWYRQTNSYQDIAVLYRSNAQSRVLEEALINANIPYRIYGGLRFFERAEIKDALAYLRLLVNRNDDAAFERVINTPTRGIGERTLSEIRKFALAQHCSLWSAATQLLQGDVLNGRAKNAVQRFIDLIIQMDKMIAKETLSKQIALVIQHSGLRDAYVLSSHEKAQIKLENLNELISAGLQFSSESEGQNPLIAFVTHAALESGENQSDAYQDCVQLMSLHAVKGLEFPLVFMSGLEEGLFPHKMSYDDPQRLEEERRLCYVGMTRAKQKLVISHAQMRRLQGEDRYNRPSRFVAEIPTQFIRKVRNPSRVSRPQLQSQCANAPFPLGSTVKHKQFGSGVVMNYEGEGEHLRVQVNFLDAGTKWLVLSYANLQT